MTTDDFCSRSWQSVHTLFTSTLSLFLAYASSLRLRLLFLLSALSLSEVHWRALLVGSPFPHILSSSHVATVTDTFTLQVLAILARLVYPLDFAMFPVSVFIGRLLVAMDALVVGLSPWSWLIDSCTSSTLSTLSCIPVPTIPVGCE
ncbi:hypothetical protein DFJ43DRAFT_1155382 [Lentinula guzmanii]|uniref:Uncharacterized protein n=1 Tax=Lentinula guzmanii TaxID=2804957 RepID=A0AA38JGM1_9AGAR|nr:hypothetical protein DFJ43DRAFT_1155382 [Lentinula guzmanii]